jgi:DNA-binding MarR family transcriptional regulator
MHTYNTYAYFILDSERMPQARHSANEPYGLESSIGFLVYKAHQQATAELRRALGPTGLTPPQFCLLALLHGQSSQRQAALCERGAIDPNTMVGILDRLEASGLVERHRDPQDRRAYLVGITTKGRQLFRRCIPLRNQAAIRSWAALSPEERSALRDMLRKALGLTQRSAADEDRTHG